MPTKATKWARKVAKAAAELEVAKAKLEQQTSTAAAPVIIEESPSRRVKARVELAAGEPVVSIGGVQFTQTEALALRDWLTATFEVIEPADEGGEPAQPSKPAKS